MEPVPMDTFDPFNSTQLRGGLLAMLLTYLTCTAVTMTTKQFIKNQGIRISIMISVRTINFLTWSIILFFMSTDIPPLYSLAIVFVQVLSYVWLFDDMPFSPCGIYGAFLESYMDIQQTIFLMMLQFIVAPIAVLLADFYLYYFCTRSHAWVGWFVQYKEDPVQFMNVPFLQAFFIEMLGMGLLSVSAYLTKSKLVYSLLISFEVVVLTVLFVSRTGFFINPLNAALFRLMYAKEKDYLGWFVVYFIAPMVGTWIGTSVLGSRLKREKPKLP